MSSLNDLIGDKEFTDRWPYCWNKLEPFLLLKQRMYAREHKGQHQQVGQFIEFIDELMSDFEKLDKGISIEARKPRHKRLNTPAT